MDTLPMALNQAELPLLINYTRICTTSPSSNTYVTYSVNLLTNKLYFQNTTVSSTITIGSPPFLWDGGAGWVWWVVILVLCLYCLLHTERRIVLSDLIRFFPNLSFFMIFLLLRFSYFYRYTDDCFFVNLFAIRLIRV